MTRLHAIRFTPAPRRLARTGIICWARCHLGAIEIDGIAVRRMRNGRTRVTWPARRDRSGREHRYVWLPDRATREAVERQILAALEAAP